MKTFSILGLCVALALGCMMTGCEWSTGSEVTSWSSNYNWVNFSGTYRSASGGYLVSDYTITPVTQGSSDPVSESNPNPGSTGKAIHLFVLVQSGQNLTITDNNGAVYSGRISELRSASGVENLSGDEGKMPLEGDIILGSFSCDGTSAARVKVKIVGTVQGMVTAGVFTGQSINATWIEKYGKTGDINGVISGVPVADEGSDSAAEDTEVMSEE